MAEQSHPAQNKVQRSLPAHIQAQLASAGRDTDTGGQLWEGRNLGEGTSHTHLFPNDDGTTQPQVQQAFADFIAGRITEAQVVDALRDSRVFAPVVAKVSHSVITEQGLVADKEADMALVSIQAPDGRKALPLFTDAGYLTQWHEQARPVAAEMRKAALSAVEDDNQLLVINPGQDLTFVVRRPALWALAKAEPWTPSYQDPRVLTLVGELVSTLPEVVDVHIQPGQGVATTLGSGQQLDGGGAGPELKIVLVLVPGMNQEQLHQTIGVFQQRLAAQRELSELIDSVQLSLASA